MQKTSLKDLVKVSLYTGATAYGGPAMFAQIKKKFVIEKKWIDEKKSEFEASTEIKQFVSLNSDTSFIDKYLKESELSDTLKRYLFSAKIGASYGPYFENSAYKIARVADIKNLPDSIRVSDILVRPKANTEDAVKQAESLADSLKNLLKKGSKFSTLAKMYSDDKTSSIKGGDLGWIKPDSLGKIFNDCFGA